MAICNLLQLFSKTIVKFHLVKNLFFLLIILLTNVSLAQSQQPAKDTKQAKYSGRGGESNPEAAASTGEAPTALSLSRDTREAGLGTVGGAMYGVTMGGGLREATGMQLPSSEAEAARIARELTRIETDAVSFGAPFSAVSGGLGPVVPNACQGIVPADVLRGLTYSGHSFDPTNALCIEARTDREAADRRVGRFVNPASPEYLGVSIPGGRVDYNPRGYYIAISETHNRTKEYMCLNPVLPTVEGITDSQTRLRNMISPRWQGYVRQDGTRDGLCVCQFGRNASDFQGTAGVCTSEYFTRVVETSSDVLGTVAVYNPGASMAAAPQAAPIITPVVQQQQVAPASTDTSNANSASRIASCIMDEYEASQNCRTLSSQASNRCKEIDEQNSPLNTTGQLLGAGAQANTVMRAGTGNQGNCMRASALAMTARATMESFGESCSSEVTACRSQCKTTSYDDFIQKCLTRNDTSVALLNDTSNTSSEAVAFREKSGSIADNYSRASRVCNVELPRVQSDTTKIVNGLGDSMQSSMACACQTSNAAGANCQAIPNINNCATNPSLQGCDVYRVVGSCAVGSASYNAKTCNCLQNPSSAGCSDSSIPTAASVFGGNLKTAPAAGGSVTAGGSAAATSASGGSNIDLSGSGSETQQADLNAEAAGTSPEAKAAVGNLGNYVGGSGAGGNGNVTDSPQAAAEDNNKNSVFGGLFNQVKNAVMNAVGKGSRGTNRSLGADQGNSKADMKKFRPLRGLANTDDVVGSRNMDIWIMMNRCMRGESCKSNMDGFIVDP